MSCGECDVISLYFLCCSVCLVCLTLCVNCLVKQFSIFLAVLLLNVTEVLSVGGCSLLDRPCMIF